MKKQPQPGSSKRSGGKTAVAAVVKLSDSAAPPPWSVEPLWKGGTAAIFAGGPSITKAQCERCRDAGLYTIAINDAYRLAPWADILYFCDPRWWEWHKNNAEFKAFVGMKVTLRPTIAKLDRSVRWLKEAGLRGLETQSNGLKTGNNSGYQAIGLAVHLGVSKIILLGYDMKQAANGKWHWFGNHPNTNPTLSLADTWKVNYTYMVKPLAERGVKVLNATPGSALESFQKVSLDDVVGRIADRLQPSSESLRGQAS